MEDAIGISLAPEAFLSNFNKLLVSKGNQNSGAPSIGAPLFIWPARSDYPAPVTATASSSDNPQDEANRSDLQKLRLAHCQTFLMQCKIDSFARRQLVCAPLHDFRKSRQWRGFRAVCSVLTCPSADSIGKRCPGRYPAPNECIAVACCNRYAATAMCFTRKAM